MATPPASKVRHPSQLLPEQRHIHLMEVGYREDTRPQNQLEGLKAAAPQVEASKQQHLDLSRSFKGLKSPSILFC
eukprot:1100456-Pelagomonas_calceolata.AAC.1